MMTYYYPFGKIQKQIFYSKGLKEGESKSFFKDEKVESISFYTKDKLEGISRFWNEQGILVFEGSYHEGNLHGKVSKFDAKTGKLILEQNYDRDQLHGQKKKFLPDGKVEITYFDHGKKRAS